MNIFIHYGIVPFSFERSHARELVLRLNEPVRSLIVVSGPRQTGKTSLVQQALTRFPANEFHAVDEPDALMPNAFASVDQGSFPQSRAPRDGEWLQHVWQRAAHRARTSPTKYVLVLDEIQKVPQWSEVVKGLWDADRAADTPMHVVLLGSAPFLMQRGLAESLAGRFELMRVTHWSLAEMRSAFGFDLAEFIFFGGFPGAASMRDDHSRWRDFVVGSLIAPHLERDILAMAEVRKPALLRHAFELGARYSGQILSYNKMLGQLTDAGNATTIAHYIELLSHVGLLVGLPQHAEQAVQRRKTSPKLNVLNTALMSAVCDYTFEDAKADRTFWGRLTESAVGAHLCNTSDRARVRYWREGRGENNPEIDFVLERGGSLIGIEVKSGRDKRAGRDAFIAKFSPDRCLLVGKEGVSFEEFFSRTADEWFEAP